MYVGEDVNGMAGYGLGKDGQITRSINDFADSLKRGVNSGSDSYSSYSVESFLDKRFAVKEIILYGVLGYVGIRLFRNWRGR